MGNKLGYPTVDLSGKVAVVTGGNTGIGYVTAKALAEMGAHTFIACRSQEKATAAIDQMKQEVTSEKDIKVDYLILDLSSFQSTKDFVRTFKEKNLPLHILINNAAIMGVLYSKTDDGHETVFEVNHLNPLLLTLELLPILLETASASGDVRIVFVASNAHMRATWNPESVEHNETQYGRLVTYGVSKLYNVMTAYALQRRLQSVNITVSTLHPGYVNTELFRSFKEVAWMNVISTIGTTLIARTPKDGAATTINCAVNPQLNSQQAFYYSDCQQKISTADSRNESYQEDLWRRSFEYLRDHLSPETVEKYGPTQEPTTTEQTTKGKGEMTATDTAIVENSGVGETTPEVKANGEGETTPTDEVATKTGGEHATPEQTTSGDIDTIKEQKINGDGDKTVTGTATTETGGEDTSHTTGETTEREEVTAIVTAAIETGAEDARNE